MLITTKTHTEVTMSYKNLTLKKRNKIEVLNNKKPPVIFVFW